MINIRVLFIDDKLNERDVFEVCELSMAAVPRIGDTIQLKHPNERAVSVTRVVWSHHPDQEDKEGFFPVLLVVDLDLNSGPGETIQ